MAALLICGASNFVQLFLGGVDVLFGAVEPLARGQRLILRFLGGLLATLQVHAGLICCFADAAHLVEDVVNLGLLAGRLIHQVREICLNGLLVVC